MSSDINIDQWVDIEAPFSPNGKLVPAKVITRSEFRPELLGVITSNGALIMIDRSCIRHVYTMDESLLMDIRYSFDKRPRC